MLELLRLSPKIKPGFTKSIYLLSRVLSLSKRYSEALYKIEQAIEHEPSNHVYQGEKKRLELLINM